MLKSILKNRNYNEMSDKFANAISDENTLESNVNSRPPVNFTNDPKYIKEFKKPIKEFEENYNNLTVSTFKDSIFASFSSTCFL